MAVVHVEDNWQTKKGSVLERVGFLWNSELLSDVKFVVPVSNGETDHETKVIPAHKFVLAIGSPVFYAMFYGQMAETTDSIELPDCEYESLLQCFRFLYTDVARLCGSNVMHVLYLAKKYMVPSLADKCAEYLRDNLVASNVFAILPHAQKFEDKDLEHRCWEVIEMHTEEAVTSDEFLTLERSLVESVVKKECLQVEEVELFKAVNRWAIKECEKQGVSSDGETKRRIIGEEIVKAIRFPLMSEKELVSIVPDCNILKESEIFDLKTSSLQFSESPRAKAIAVSYHRFGTFEPPDDAFWSYESDRSDRICVTVSKDINLHGVQHFGRQARSYAVSLEINLNGSCIVKQSGSYVSVRNAKEYFGFDVMFDNPVCLIKDAQYEIVSLIEGDLSWYGEDGKGTVRCLGVDFTFSDSPNKISSTGASRGQFPALLFSCKN